MGYSEGDSEKSGRVWLVGVRISGDGPTVLFGTVDHWAPRLAGDSESRNNNNSLYSTLPGKYVIVSFR